MRPHSSLRLGLVIATMATGSVDAQQQVRLERASGQHTIVNGLPIPIVALVRDRTDSLASALAFRVERGGTAAAGDAGRRLELEYFEPVAHAVPLRASWQPSCGPTDHAALASAIAQLQAQRDAAPIEGSAEANAAISVATQLAQLRLERTRDSLDAQRNDPLDFTLRLQGNRTASAMQLAKQRDADRQESVDHTIEDIGFAAIAYADAASAKYEVLQRDADQYRTLLDQSEGALAAVRARLTSVDRELAAQRSFQATLLSAIEVARPANAAGLSLRSATSVSRACARPAAISDEIEIIADADPALAILVADIGFDRDGRGEVVVRRIRDTNRWIGRIHWPTSATSARVRVRAPWSSDWRPMGTIQSGRASLSSMRDGLEAQVGAARKRFKDATFRAEGADHVKSVMIP